MAVVVSFVAFIVHNLLYEIKVFVGIGSVEVI